jgi:hypothetical protein
VKLVRGRDGGEDREGAGDSPAKLRALVNETGRRRKKLSRARAASRRSRVMEPRRREAQDPEIRRISDAGDRVNPAGKGREGLGGRGESVVDGGGRRERRLVEVRRPSPP